MKIISVSFASDDVYEMPHRFCARIRVWIVLLDLATDNEYVPQRWQTFFFFFISS